MKEERPLCKGLALLPVGLMLDWAGWTPLVPLDKKLTACLLMRMINISLSQLC